MDGGIRQSPLTGPTDTHHLAAVHSPAFECRPVCPVRRLSADQSAQSGERGVARPRSASSKDGRLSAILRGVRPQEAHAHSHLDVPCCLIFSHSGVPMIAFRLGSGAIYGKRLFAYSPWLPPGGPSTTDRKGGDGVTFHRAMAGPTRNRQRQFWRRRSSARPRAWRTAGSWAIEAANSLGFPLPQSLSRSSRVSPATARFRLRPVRR